MAIWGRSLHLAEKIALGLVMFFDFLPNYTLFYYIYDNYIIKKERRNIDIYRELSDFCINLTFDINQQEAVIINQCPCTIAAVCVFYFWIRL